MKKAFKNEEGFTLIEIIAALVILGILAAVAVPRYLELIEEANQKAADGALAAGFSNVSMQYGTGLLSFTGDEMSALNFAISTCTAELADLGDYSASYGGTSTASSGTAAVYVVDENTSSYSASGSFSIY